MEDNIYFLNHAKKSLEEIFKNYYDLIFGVYNLKEWQELKIRELSKAVKNEVFEKEGKFYSLFDKIHKVKREIYDLEDEVKKDDNNFDVDEGLAVQIVDLYDDAMQEISKQMFMYGVKYGQNMEKCLDEFTVNSPKKETTNSRFEYSVDYSENGYFDEAKDDKLDNLIREALNLNEDEEDGDRKIELDPEKMKKFSVIKQKLHHIAVENSTLMRVKMLPDSTKMIIELESETLDFDTEELKNKFIDVLKCSKSVSFDVKSNGKIEVTVEVDVSK